MAEMSEDRAAFDAWFGPLLGLPYKDNEEWYARMLRDTWDRNEIVVQCWKAAWAAGREHGRGDTVGTHAATGYARDRAIMAAVLEAHGDCPHSTGTSNWAHWVGSRVVDALEKSHG